MSNKIHIGQYVAKQSYIHRLDARVKIIFLILYILTIFLIPNLDLAFFILALLPFILIVASKINAISLIRSALPLIIMFIILASFTFFGDKNASKGGEVLINLPFLYVSTGDVIYFLHRSLILICATVAGALLLATTSPLELTEGLAYLFSPLQRLKVPVSELAIILALALRFIPHVASLAKTIADAQKLRGAHLDHGSARARLMAVTSLILPITLATIRVAENLSLSLLSKNYIPGLARTKWDFEGFKKRQKIKIKTDKNVV